MVLPPMVEWARVATAFAEHRNSTHLDTDDVMQVLHYDKVFYILRDPINSNLLALSVYKSLTHPRIL